MMSQRLVELLSWMWVYNKRVSVVEKVVLGQRTGIVWLEAQKLVDGDTSKKIPKGISRPAARQG
jgi:hypothetical protein